MRRTVVPLLILGLAACTPTTIKNQPEAPGSESSHPPAKKTASVGDTITLKGNDDKLVMAITVMKLVDPGQPADDFLKPDKGNRFVAVRLRLKNVGSAAFDDSPGNGAVMLDTEQQSYEADIYDVKGCKSFASGVAKIAPGAIRVGCIVFQVPKQTKLAGFQFTLDSGFGPETGEWTV